MKYLIPIEPVAKGRPRFTKTGRTYSPKKNVDFEKAVVDWADKQTWVVHESDVPLSVIVDFYIKRPKSVSVKKRPLPVVRSDIDNYLKAILDSLNGIAWADDCQIVELKARKMYSVKGSIELTISVYEED